LFVLHKLSFFLCTHMNFTVSFTDAEHRARRSGDPTGTQVFGCMIQDYDGDNWDDLWCVTDFGNTKIFLNDGNGSFVDDAYAPPNHSFDQEFGPYSLSQSSSYRSGRGVVDAMGSTIGDINEDGRIDVFVTAISCPGCNEKNVRGCELRTKKKSCCCCCCYY